MFLAAFIGVVALPHASVPYAPTAATLAVPAMEVLMNHMQPSFRTCPFDLFGSQHPISSPPYPQTTQPLLSLPPFPQGGRHVRLGRETAAAFLDMQSAARNEDDVYLGAISGFRTLNHQSWLYDKALAKYRSAAIAGQWVAPPGFSEHHTGLALDIGDLDVPLANVEISFERTRAYRWLTENAHRFDFELSFPKRNDAGTPTMFYEPWHWRFVGLCP